MLPVLVPAKNSSEQESRCVSNVSVVKPADLGKLDHPSQFRFLDGSPGALPIAVPGVETSREWLRSHRTLQLPEDASWAAHRSRDRDHPRDGDGR
jgi:hypothetical protein